ncbi:hypothetical protein BX600DRAFT_518076 [Xylariales sp. PMI_506]|nr:hypothetical protein BX600DRAFT_518076 [Xylariales sp. PMI_506]
MATLNPGALEDGKMESLRVMLSAALRETIGEKIKKEELGSLSQEMVNILNADAANNIKVRDLIWSTYESYQTQCRELLERIRPILHEAVDELMSELMEKGIDEVGSQRVLRPPVPNFTSAASINQTRSPGTIGRSLTPRNVPEADMGPLLPDPQNSVGQAIIVEDDDHLSVGRANPSRNMDPSSSGTGRRQQQIEGKKRKRSAGAESSKRVKAFRPKTVNKNELNPAEHIFQREGHEGYYVIRCDRAECVRNHEPEELYFQDHPLTSKKAKAHFAGTGHHMKNPNTIFRNYAYRVISNGSADGDAPIVNRTSHATPTRTSAEKTPGASVVRPITPQSPLISSKGKGKQQEPIRTGSGSASSARLPFTPIRPRADGTKPTARRTAAVRSGAGSNAASTVPASDKGGRPTVESEEAGPSTSLLNQLTGNYYNTRRHVPKTYREPTRDDVEREFLEEQRE